MSPRAKSAVMLLAVLALGIAIGVLLAGVLHNRRLERLARMRTGPGIAQLVERVVQPESAEQRERIREIMDGAAPRFAEIFESTHEEMRALSDSVFAQLEDVLTEDQLAELRRHLEMRRPPPPAEGGRRRRSGRPREGPD